MQDVLGHRKLHLPGFQEVEALAVLLVKQAEGDRHLIPVELRSEIGMASIRLHDHDRSARNFVKKYESKCTLFGRCLGPDYSQSSAAQKTKFGWQKFAQAAPMTEESRLLYLVIQLLKNHPTVAVQSPSKTATNIRWKYKRICDRLYDDAILSKLNLPLPNINNKSITNFIHKQEVWANLLATAQPNLTVHRKVLSEERVPEAAALAEALPQPECSLRRYDVIPHESGKRRGGKEATSFGRARDFVARASGICALVAGPEIPFAPTSSSATKLTDEGVTSSHFIGGSLSTKGTFGSS